MQLIVFAKGREINPSFLTSKLVRSPCKLLTKTNTEQQEERFNGKAFADCQNFCSFGMMMNSKKGRKLRKQHVQVSNTQISLRQACVDPPFYAFCGP